MKLPSAYAFLSFVGLALAAGGIVVPTAEASCTVVVAGTCGTGCGPTISVNCGTGNCLVVVLGTCDSPGTPGDGPGNCTVTVQDCNANGDCTVNIDTCNGDCLVNLGQCSTTGPGRCEVNIAFCQGHCTLNVLGVCDPTETCLVHIEFCRL